MRVLWLGEEACHDIRHVGGKAANLSRLAAEFRVPSGFCIAPMSHARWLNRAQVKSAAPLIDSSALLEAVAVGYRDLAASCRVEEPAVAVRSSAVEEDGRESSFAGQYDTYLNIRGPEAIVAAVLRCWESAYGERVASYRSEHNLSSQSLGVAVLVQQLVPAELSGVAFSANPISGIRDEVMINASWGLGESVVSGKVTPDCWITGKSDFRVKESYIGAKRLKTVLDAEGIRETPVARSEQMVLCLDEPKVREITRLAVQLESRMGWPVDLEFAYLADQLYVLQCRPITTL